MLRSSKAQGKRPVGETRTTAAAPGARKKRAGGRKPWENADVGALMGHSDFLVPRIAEAVAKTERFALIATWRAVSLEFCKELQPYVEKLVASFNGDLKLRGSCLAFEKRWTYWLKLLPRDRRQQLSVNDETPLADRDLTEKHLSLVPPYRDDIGRPPDVNGLPSDVPLEMVPRMIARCAKMITDAAERLAHSAGRAQVNSLAKFLSVVYQQRDSVLGPDAAVPTRCFEFGSYTLFAMAASTCELCCVGGKARFCKGVNAGHGGRSFDLLPDSSQLVYSRGACLCAHMAKQGRWQVHQFGTETQMRCDLERGIVVADSERRLFFSPIDRVTSVDDAQIRWQLEQRALMRAMLRVAFAPTKEVKLDPHELRRLVGGQEAFRDIFGAALAEPLDTRYVWLRNHPCVPRGFSLQSRLKLTDAQMDRAAASVARQTEEIRLSAKVLVSNELERYKEDFVEMLHLDSLMRGHTFESVEAELPGTTSLFEFLVHGNSAYEHVSGIPGVAHLATTVTTMLTVGVRYDSAYSGSRASPWAYSYVCGVSSGWLVPEASKDRGKMLRMALDVCGMSARWQETNSADDQQRILREWETRVIAMYAFDALEWNTIVVEPNEDIDDDDPKTALLDEVRTYFCSWSVAGVTVRTLHSNLYNPTAIRAAARILLNRSGYASDKLPGVDKPYPVFLEGVARLLAFAPETRAAALCLLSPTPLCTALYTEDLIDAGLSIETLAPVASYMRDAAGSE